MKKTLLLLASAAMLLVGCAKEKLGPDAGTGEMVTANFTAQMQGMPQTKAVTDGEGTKANRCVMEIYYKGVLYTRDVQPIEGMKATFTPRLVSNRTYDVLFWADCGEDLADKYYTTDAEGLGLQAVEMKATAYAANDDARDAFYTTESVPVGQQVSSETFTLTRPFAQVNIITTDAAVIKNANLYPDGVKMVFTAPTKFNLLTETLSEEKALTVTGTPYETFVATSAALTLEMDYLFTGEDKSALDIAFEASKTGEATTTHSFTNIPVQRNYRTNIKGALLTTTGDWTATIEPTWSTPAYDVPFLAASTIKEAQDYIAPAAEGTQTVKVVDLSKATISTDDIKGEDKKIEFKLKTTSPVDMVNFALPEIPQDVLEAGCTGWKITYEEGYPTQNVNVTAPTGTSVTIEAPNSHVTLNGEEYEQVTATTSQSTLVVPAGVTINNLIVKEGAVEIHGVVNNLTVSPAQGKTVCFRECEGLSAEVFAAIKGEGHDYIDSPMYTYELVGEKYNIYKLPVVAMIGEAEYPSITAALAAVKANETIEILSDIALDGPIAISKSDITIDGNSHIIAVSDAEYWNQYKIGGANQGLGKVNMISVKGSDFTLKDVTLDGKDCRGVSLCTTSGGKEVLYQNVTYTGRGSGHYYGEAAGLVTFDGCKFDTHGYAVHFGGESSVDDDVVIKDCELNGWSSFGACKSVTISDSHFGGANDEGKNGWLAVLRPYCPTTITNCTFSDIFLHEAVTGYDCIGLGTGAATTVVLKGCKIVNDSKEETDAAIYSIVRDNGFGDEAAQQGSVFAFDATGNATDGYTAGTFYAKNPAKIKVAPSYEVKPVEGKENIYTVAVKPVAEFNGQKYTSFEAALNAAKADKGGKVTLVDDVTLTRTDYKGCSSSDEDFATRLYVIDLNGHKISGGLFAFEDCSYTIEDSVGGGSISRDGTCLQLNVSQFMASKMCTFDTCPTFTVTGGDFIGAGDLNNPYSCKYGAQIGAMGTYDHKFGVSKFLISGGKIRNMRIYNGKGEISGGTFEGQLKIEVCTESSDKYASGVTYSDFVTTITGGNFNLAETNPIFGADYAKDRLGDHLQIKGGTFNFNPSVYYSACIPAGYTSQDNGDGTWTVVAEN